MTYLTIWTCLLMPLRTATKTRLFSMIFHARVNFSIPLQTHWRSLKKIMCHTAIETQCQNGLSGNYIAVVTSNHIETNNASLSLSSTNAAVSSLGPMKSSSGLECECTICRSIRLAPITAGAFASCGSL